MTTHVQSREVAINPVVNRAPSALRETWLVIRREALTRVTNRTIQFATMFLAVGVGIGAYFGGRALQDFTGGIGAMNLRPEVLLPSAMVVLLLTALVYSSSSLTSGVVEEKQSRVVEILLTKIGVVPLIAGKVIGIGLVTLTQLLLIGGAAALGFTRADGWGALGVEAPGVILAWLLLWFFLGYAVFALLNTILASTVSRQEDLGTALVPLTIVQMALLGVAMFGSNGGQANETWFKALSFVPLASSYLMPVRLGIGEVETYELVIAAGVAVIVIPLLFKLATLIYRNTALRTGSKLSLIAAITPQERKVTTMSNTTDQQDANASAARKRKLIVTAAQFAAGVVVVYIIVQFLR